jgi:drug/metabolite transporter (DMT)-like permease
VTAQRRATIWLLAMCAVWGSSFFSMQLAINGIATVVGERAAPVVSLFWRFLAALILYPLVLPGAVRALSWRVVGLGFLLSLPFYAGFLLQMMGLPGTTPTICAFLTNLSVVFTPILGFLVFRERLSWATVFGALVALGGVYVLTNPTGGGFGVPEQLTVAAAAAFTVQIQMTNIITRRASPEAITWVMFAWMVAYAGAQVGIMGIEPDTMLEVWRGPDVTWAILYNAVFCSVVAITVMNRFQRDIAPTRAAVLYALEPLFAAFFAATFVDEAMTWRKLAGGAIIIAGNLVCELRRPPAAIPVASDDPSK